MSGDASRSASGGKKRAGRKKASREEAALSFEDAFSIAEGAAEGLERGDLTLEASLEEYEKGLRALGRCYEVLKHLDRKIEVLGSELGSVVEGEEGVTWRSAEDTKRLKEALGEVERPEELPLHGTDEEPADEEEDEEDQEP